MIFFIINPAAGRGKSGKIMNELCTILNDKNVEYHTVFTHHKGHAVNLCRIGCEKGYDTIVAVGGDGTVREVVEGMRNHKHVKLGIIPTGTGNDFIKSLNIPKSPKIALDIILEGNTRVIDSGNIGKRMFVNIATLGFDAQVVACANNIPILSGFAAYFFATILTLFKLKCKPVTIEYEDGSTSTHNILLVAICNGKQYGGGYNVAPHAKLDDANFEVIIAENFSRWRVLRLLPKYVKGTYLDEDIKGISSFKCSSITLHAEEDSYFNADGELSKDKTLSFSINPSALIVLAPKDSEQDLSETQDE